MKVQAFTVLSIVAAAGLALAAFTLNTFPLQTSVTGTTTNLCTNVTADVTQLDTISLQFSATTATSNTGNSTVSIAFKRGLGTNMVDTGTFTTWTFSTAGWGWQATNSVSTNLFGVRDFRTLVVYSIANGNTSTLSNVTLTYGSTAPYGRFEP